MAIENVNSVTAAGAYQATSSVPMNKEVTPAKAAENIEAQSQLVGKVSEAKKIEKSGEGENGYSGSFNENGGNNSQQPSEKAIQNALKDISKKLNDNTIAEFGYHEGTKRIMIKIKDKDTDEVIKEVPAEKTLDLIQKAWELAGLLVDEKR